VRSSVHEVMKVRYLLALCGSRRRYLFRIFGVLSLLFQHWVLRPAAKKPATKTKVISRAPKFESSGKAGVR
jgi:hypothetical protein